MKKYILLIMIIFLSGCSANLNIAINDSSINESISIKEEKSLFNNISYNDYINEMVGQYKDDIKSYEISNFDNSDYVGIKLNKKYDNDICSSINNSKLKYISDNLSCVKDKNKYKITGSASYFICGDDCFMPPEISYGTLNITLPNKAIKSNSDSVDGNTYTWNFDNNKDNKFSLEFEIKDTKKDTNIIDVNSKENRYAILIIILIIGVIGIIVIDLYNKYKSKKIKY